MSSVLVIGVGFVGAPFLTSLRKAQPSIAVTAFLRSDKYDKQLALHNIAAVHGTFDETERISELSSKHDIVVNAADSENVPLTRAIIEGLKKNRGTLLHVSGAGNFFDGGNDGTFKTDGKLWSDSNEEDIRMIDDSMKNGAVDKLILEAGSTGAISTYVVCPVGVYGQATSDIEVPSQGVFITGAMMNVIQLGYSPYMNEGTTVFQLVHIDDVIALMQLVFDKAIKGDLPGNAYQRYYVAAGTPYQWKELAALFGKALYRDGKISKPDPVSVRAEDAGFMSGAMQQSMRVTDDNARSIGYKEQGPSLAETLESVTFQ